MKNLIFFRVHSTFILFLWLFGHSLNAQQLICPPLLASPSSSGVPFSENWNIGLSSGTKYIPTVVHLIGDASTLTYTQVKTAIDQLNVDFADPNGKQTIVFVLATVGDRGQCSDGISRHPNITYNDQLYKQKTIWPNEKYLNIWVLSNPDVIGQVSVRPSTFQVINGELKRTDYIAGQNAAFFDGEDGVTVNTSEIYPNSTGGHTLTHETGHWLNLLHVFSPCEAPISWNPSIWDCCGVGASHGDFIEDTPPQSLFATANPADCNQVISSCGTSTVSQENFMSYGGPCINSFSNGQRSWMTHCLDNFRPDIWSEKNLQCTGVVSENNPLIATGQNIIWNTSKTVTGSLIIESGAKLTIKSGVVIQFCDLGKVIVKQGGRLDLYGTLTSSCVGRMWQGVEVWGTKNKNQLNQIAFQGQFWGYSGALIEHAKTGILLDNPADATGSSTGGVLICDGVSFLNNARAVQFNPYENKFPNNQITSIRGSFTTCLFETNNDYRGDNLDFYEPAEIVLFRSFADLKGVRGLNFHGCKFQNMRDNNPFALETFYGFGILATEAGFTVSDFCTGPTTPTFPAPPCAPNFTVSSSFKNLFVGIVAGNTDINGVKPYSYQVTKTLFEGNWTGIQSSAGSRAIISRNTFKLGKIPPNSSPVQGIKGVVLHDTHTSFTVQENTFLRDPAISQDVADFWSLTGIEAVSIGEYSNQIRKNYFTDLKIGNRSVGANATPFGDIGLLYLCNENSSNDNFDFKIENNSRVKSIQGRPDDGNPNILGPAGNFFSLTGPAGSDSDFKNKFDITYVHGTTLLEVPQFFDANHFLLSLVNQPRSCESIYCDPPCRTEAEVAIIRSQIDSDATSRDSLNALLLIGSSDQTIADDRRKSRNFFNYRIHTNATEVLTQLAFTDEGDNTVFREIMAKTNAYDADLALANDYLGSNEVINYTTLINSLITKYQLTGTALDEHNAYRSVMDMVAQHYLSGGNKFNLSSLQIEWLKDIADNSAYVRSRGIARRILSLYGYYYPADYKINSDERSMYQPTRTTPNLFSIFPNPADQQVQIHIETGKKILETVSIILLRPDGAIQAVQHTKITGSGDFVFNLRSFDSGIYLIQVQLESGEVQTKRIAIIH